MIMSYEIKKVNLPWRDGNPGTPYNKSRVTGIALHHIVSNNASIQDIHRWHRNNNWNGIGYQYYVRLNGEIYEARGNHVGVHVANQNSVLIGIAFEGNYHPVNNIRHLTEMPDEQFNAGIWLIEKIKADYPNIREVDGHNRWQATACPGRFFPLSEFKRGQYRGNGVRKHEIAAGDTLWSLSQQYGTTVAELERLNPAIKAEALPIGYKLVVSGEPAKDAPAPREYKTNYPLDNVVLRRGSRGTSVRRMQAALNAVHFRPGPIDGSFGPKTEDAVRRFQSVYTPRMIDGIFGPKTRGALVNELERRGL